MPYYLGKNAPRSQNVPMVVSSIVPGLEQVRGEPGRANIRLVPIRASLTSKQIFTHPASFFGSHRSGHATVLDTFTPLFNAPDEVLPIANPDLVVSFRNGIPETHANKLKEIGYNEINIRGRSALLFSHPTLGQLQTISSTGPTIFTNTPLDAVNLQQMRDVSKISKLLLEHYTILHFIGAIEGEWGTNGCIVAGKNHHSPEIDVNGKPFRIATTNAETYTVEWKDDKITKDTGNLFTIPPYRTEIKYVKKFEKSVVGGGIFLPYIRGLSSPDYNTVPDFIKEKYYVKLGATNDEKSRAFNSIVGSWISIAQTSWGLQVSHLVKCMMLAEEGYALGINMFSNGSIYSGCVIRGTFNISYHNSVYHSLSEDELKAELDQVNDHQQALEAILAIAEKNFNGTYAKPTNITSMRQLHEHLINIPFSPDDKKDIIDYASKLSFNERPEPNGTSSLKNVFQYLVNRTVPIPNTIYLDHRYLLSSDRVETVFAAFGNAAPTFTTPGGSKTAVSSTISRINSGTKRRYGFTLRSVPIPTAVAEFRQIESTKYVYNFAENRGKGIRERNLTGKEKEDVWALLGDMVGINQTDNPNAPSGSNPKIVASVPSSNQDDF